MFGVFFMNELLFDERFIWILGDLLGGFGLSLGESFLFFLIDGLFWDLVRFLNFKLFKFFVIDSVLRLIVSFFEDDFCDILFFFIDWLFGVWWISFLRKECWFLFDLFFDNCFFGFVKNEILLWFVDVFESFFSSGGLLGVCELLLVVLWGFLLSEFEFVIIEFEFEVRILCRFLLGMFKIFVLLFLLWFNIILLLFMFWWLWNFYSLFFDGVCFIFVVCFLFFLCVIFFLLCGDVC